MRTIRLALVEISTARTERVSEAIEAAGIGVSRTDELASADVVVVSADLEGTYTFQSAADGKALVVLLGGSADACFDSRFDAVWTEPLGPEDVAPVVVRALGASPGANRSSRRALETILATQQARGEALRAQLTREERALRSLREPPGISARAPFVEIDDEGAFASVVRHEERRARREGTTALLLAFDADQAAGGAVILRSHDVALRRMGGGWLALRADASDALVARAREDLGDRVMTLPDGGDATAFVCAKMRD